MLKARGLHKSYTQADQKLDVLSGVSLDVDQGEFVTMFGPSGAGKSTLLHILGGLDAPDQGSVVLDGADVYAMSDLGRSKLRNTKIGFVFQFYHLLQEFTALENVILPLMVQKGCDKKQEIDQAGLDLLEKVGLKERAKHKPYQLSGGEQQRVAIARALVNNPKIIFCDEPTGNLDSKSGRMIIDTLSELNKDQRQTFVVVTHDENIAKVSGRVLNMRDGKFEEN